MNIRDVLARNIRRLIDEKGINAETAAERAGMPGPQIHKYLTPKGKQGPTLEILARLATGLGVTAAELLTDRDAAPAREHGIEECARRWAEATLSGELRLGASHDAFPPSGDAPAEESPREQPSERKPKTRRE